jgi:hypothetical protein
MVGKGAGLLREDCAGCPSACGKRLNRIKMINSKGLVIDKEYSKSACEFDRGQYAFPLIIISFSKPKVQSLTDWFTQAG